MLNVCTSFITKPLQFRECNFNVTAMHCQQMSLCRFHLCGNGTREVAIEAGNLYHHCHPCCITWSTKCIGAGYQPTHTIAYWSEVQGILLNECEAYLSVGKRAIPVTGL
jgi:hypothetical protein